MLGTCVRRFFTFEAQNDCTMLPLLKDMKPADLQAFGGGRLTPIVLNPGTSLYRFSGWDIVNPKTNAVSPWWSESNGLIEVLLAAKSSGKTLEHFVRTRSAVLRAWNNISCLVLIRLNKPKEAYSGTIEFQNEAKRYFDRSSAQYKQKFTKPVYFGGGGKQVWVPELKTSEFSVTIPQKTIHITDHVDEIIDFLVSYGLL